MHLDKSDFGIFMFSKLGIVLVLFLILPLKYAILTLLVLAFTY